MIKGRDTRVVVFAGAGTGGHLMPGLAVARRLVERADDVAPVFLGAGRPLEARILEPSGFPYLKAPSRPVPSSVAKLPGFLLASAFALAKSFWLLLRLRAKAVVGLGGYGAVWPVLAGRLCALPTILLEQNVLPGKATRIAGRFADLTCVAFDETRGALAGARRTKLTGNPVRSGLGTVARADARRGLNLHRGERMLLVVGGSQGAESVNELVCTAAAQITRTPLLILHQVGEGRETSEPDTPQGVRYRAVAFINAMDQALAAADLVVSRAGATMIAELAAAGKPSILIPYPHATEDHQRRNAELLERAGAAVMLQQATACADTLAALIDELLGDESRLQSMSETARSLAHEDAADAVADEVLKAVALGSP